MAGCLSLILIIAVSLIWCSTAVLFKFPLQDRCMTLPSVKYANVRDCGKEDQDWKIGMDGTISHNRSVDKIVYCLSGVIMPKPKVIPMTPCDPMQMSQWKHVGKQWKLKGTGLCLGVKTGITSVSLLNCTDPDLASNTAWDVNN